MGFYAKARRNIRGLLRGVAGGSTALTGIEAVGNAVPPFTNPRPFWPGELLPLFPSFPVISGVESATKAQQLRQLPSPGNRSVRKKQHR